MTPEQYQNIQNAAPYGFQNGYRYGCGYAPPYGCGYPYGYYANYDPYGQSPMWNLSTLTPDIPGYREATPFRR